MSVNREDPTRILVTGLNWSGSGTVVGLLQEFEGVFQIPGGAGRMAPAGYVKLGEFSDFRGAGMVGDQIGAVDRGAHASTIMSTVKRRRERNNTLSLVRTYVKPRRPSQLIHGVSQARELARLNACLARLAKDFEHDIDPAFRIARARRWIAEVVSTVGSEPKRAAVFDQPINFGQHDDYWPAVFDPYKLIIVHRDPRDQFAEWIKHGYLARVSGDIGYLYGWDVDAAIQYRIDATWARMQAVDRTMANLATDKVLLVSFERIVRDYDKTRDRILDFLQLQGSRHLYPRRFFDPDWSIRNIGVHRTSPMSIPKERLEKLITWHEERMAQAAYSENI